MQKNSFVLQTRLNAIVAKLSDKQAGTLFKGVLNYATNGVKANFDDGMVDVVFEMVRQDIDYNNRKYEETCVRNSSNGKKGGAPKGNHNAQKQPKTTDRLKNNPKQPKTTENKHNDVDNDVDVDIDNELLDKSNNKEKEIKEKEISISTRFVKPTVEEIKAYCTERNNGIDAQSFFDFYQSKGWKVGNTPMKDWRACVRTWERKNKETVTPVNASANEILEFMLANYEDKGLAQNPVLKARYVKKWAKTADDLVNACGGDVKLAEQMIKHYANKQTEEWYLWGVLNNFCGLYDELKRRQYVK